MAAAAKKRDPATQPGWNRHHVAIAGVIVLALLDVILVVWALVAARTPPDATVPVATSSTTVAQTPSATPKPTASATPKPTSTPAADAVAPTRVLAALDGSTAWRASTGPCPATPASPEITTDGGANWKPTDAAGPTGASSILAISVQSAKQASAITLASQGCAPQYIRTYVAGDNWAAYPDQLAGSWYVDATKRSVVHTPTGDVQAPCAAVIGVAVRDPANAAVLCANHDVHVTGNAGAAWGQAVPVTGAVAISTAGNGYVLAVTGRQGCAGTATTSFDGGTAQAAGGCATSTKPPAGGVSVANGGGTLWMWSGDTVVKSTDGGVTWR
ncbi:hypothetical protein G3T36_06240 [Diaminobutyricibacter tongyongensis]|uniref:Exo-alpha-sialidase n=1 Tax=Leifsonia tongyongensis TaxID=1268043 RepID=A0A6L9XVZ7_9MICO|nr:hypothetical protein [Diaminobutyricibacter tongyongensis]NEN05466.1 hypothetical protein [Diaminobutyricibacter tongyongensis]